MNQLTNLRMHRKQPLCRHICSRGSSLCLHTTRAHRRIPVSHLHICVQASAYLLAVLVGSGGRSWHTANTDLAEHQQSMHSVQWYCKFLQLTRAEPGVLQHHCIERHLDWRHGLELGRISKWGASGGDVVCPEETPPGTDR